MKGKTMSDKNNGWEKPEEKFPETELEDSFAGFFSEEEVQIASEEGKKRRKKKKGPDILAVSEETDPGFVITEVVALDAGDGIVAIGEAAAPEKEEEIPSEHAEEEALPEECENPEEPDAHAENEPEEEALPEEEETVVVDLSAKEEESPAEKAPEKKKLFNFEKVKLHIGRKRKHKYVATVGAVLIALALIGTLSLVSVLINLGARIIDNSSMKEDFEWKIYALLMLDPATFDDPNQLDSEFLLKTSLWANLLENRTKYSYNEQMMLLVPASDLDVAAKSLFGSSVTLEHRSFSEGYEFNYIYDEETATYMVPVSGQSASYVPKVVDIKKTGSTYTLIVGYVAPTTLWNVSEDGSAESVPSKYLYYDLEKLGYKDYVIKSVRKIPEEELPDNLETAEMHSLNETQYFEYDDFYQEQLDELMGAEDAEENTSGEGVSGESGEEESSASSSSGEESSGESSSEADDEG